MAQIGRTFITTKIIEITSCSFPFMWYNNKIGLRFEVIEMSKKDLFVPQDIESYVCRTINPPIPNKPDLQGWVLAKDYTVISESTKEIQKD